MNSHVIKQLTLVWLLVFMPAAYAASAQATPIWMQQTMNLADARHLAGRTGFGATAKELSVLVGLSRAEAVARVTDGINQTPHIPMPSWVEEPAPRFWKRAILPPDEQQAFDRDRDEEIAELRQWWVSNMLQSDSPQTERLVLFWHDHFATSYAGVNRRSISIARQNQTFRALGSGSYRALLKAMIRDPALLIYLDNQNNRKGRPNENLARELLELFTLGEGHYDETTVKEAARALTGYGYSETRNHSFRFFDYKHDKQSKELFGITKNHNGDTLIDAILEQPAAARHLVKKFWAAFVSDRDPEESFVAALSDTFRQSDYDLLTLYEGVLQSQHFWENSNRLSLIKSPATLLIGTARSLDYPKRAWSQLPSLHALLGMDLFAPPNVAGWAEGAAFVAPGRLLNRQLALQAMLETSNQTTQAAGETMMSDSMMMNDTSSPSAGSIGVPQSGMSMLDQKVSMQTSGSAPLSVRLAGHFFEGAPRYKVSLHRVVNAQEEVLWTSEVRELKIGYDTKMFGEMKDRSVLPWVEERYHPPAGALDQATRIDIAFLNDAADKTGDRNLFVDSVVLNKRKISAAGANQVSGCAPKSKRAAGDLYCSGTVSIDIGNVLPVSLVREESFTATDAAIIWTRQQGNANTHPRLDAIIALENVQTPDNFYHTVSFHLFSKDKDSLELRLDHFGCWPDCITIFPECAWHEASSEQKVVSFPLVRGTDEHIDCHYDSLAMSEQQLVNALWKSVPGLIGHVLNNENRQRHTRNLQLWEKRIQLLKHRISTSDYALDAGSILIDSNYPTPAHQRRVMAEPQIAIADLAELERRVTTSEMSLVDLLIGGADISDSSELSAKNNESFEYQLDYLLSHPVYQVY